MNDLLVLGAVFFLAAVLLVGPITYYRCHHSLSRRRRLAYVLLDAAIATALLMGSFVVLIWTRGNL